MAGFAVLAIMIQTLSTLVQYTKKSWREHLGRTLAALLGLGPLVEGFYLWTGKEDKDLVMTGAQMYAIMKGVEIAFESIPESIIQIGGLLSQKYDDIQTIQVIGVVSSVISGAFIMTDANFAMSLFAQAFGTRAPVFILIGVEYCAVCAYMGWKGKLFGWSLMSQPSTFNSYMGPFVAWAFYYLLVSAVPMLITANSTELGPEVFAGTMVWRLLTNGGIVYVAFGELAMKGHYLSLETGMAGYGISLGLAAVALVMFFKNCDPDFDRSLFWREKLGKQRTRDCWSDDEIWERTFKTKDEEKWKGWVETIHPTHLPFDLMTPWIKSLVEKYGDEGVERPR
ncbi:hypothetical protein TrLO_g1264 [Triparma laevis f. longispina]|uniref:Uncharacterized protein n=1 Tax=Triparma laevis f. longispina TaxID=1714387 RepID=A0A9W7AGZ8_9STRA|nr:hypothetical protein TrLO_g1264 [Triparma laevis f. longispina]